MARFTNQAQLRYGNEITNSNIAVGEITEVLSATKTAVRDTYGQNENVTYVISIVNSGTTAFNGITVTDNLGEYSFNTRELTPLTYSGDRKILCKRNFTGNTGCNGRPSSDNHGNYRACGR